MANRKSLKKIVKCTTSELLTDCAILNLCEQDADEKYATIIADIVALHNEMVSRISHTEKGSERLFYKKLRAEFDEQVNLLHERIIKG